MNRNQKALLEAATALTAAAYAVEGDESLQEQLLDVAHQIRSNVLLGSLPDKAVMAGLNRLLNDLGLEWMVIGGMAVAVHGQLRETADIDVMVNELPDPAKTMDADYMSKFEFYRGKSRTGGHLVLDHKQGQCEFLPATDDWQRWALSTATPRMVLGLSVPVVSAEGLVVLKLKAMTANPKRVARDAPDVLSVIAENPELNFNEIEAHLTDREKERLASLRSSAV